MRRGGSTQLHVLSCYAPTFAAKRDSPHEPYIILGDLNARVGMISMPDDEREFERHGFGEVNEAGRGLLAFLSLNEATICKNLVHEVRHKQANLEAPEIQQVALH